MKLETTWWTLDELDEKGINPWTDVLTEAEFRQHFGYKNIHLQVLIILNTTNH